MIKPKVSFHRGAANVIYWTCQRNHSLPIGAGATPPLAYAKWCEASMKSMQRGRV